MAQTQRKTQTRRTPPTTQLRENSYELYIPPRFHWERTHGEEKTPEKSGTRKPRDYRAPIKVVAVYDNGECEHFQTAQDAALRREEMGGGKTCINSILHCCRHNQLRKSLLHGPRTPSSEHRFSGVRYYFESDNIWRTKVGESVKEKENKQKTQIWRQWL